MTVTDTAQMVALLVVTDGRADCLRRTLSSFEEMVDGPIGLRIIVDDSADPDYGRWLERMYGSRYEIAHHAARLGFCRTWKHAHSLAPAALFVLLQEDDFVYRRPVDLWAMVDVLAKRPHLAQISLVRQPWSEEEKRAGSILASRRSELRHFEAGPHHWTEGRLHFTTNPSLTRRAALAAWGDGPECEGRLGRHLLEHGFGDVGGPDVSFGYWGQVDDDPWVWHVGDTRAGEGY